MTDGVIGVGSAVSPVNGRFAGIPMVVVGLSEGYAFVCDGRKRRTDKPKRKKLCHLRLLSPDSPRMTADAELTNGKIRRYLASFRADSTIPNDKKRDSNH